MRACALILVLLGACTVAPPPETPNLGVDVPAAWTAGRAAESAGSQGEQDTWWTGFGDPQLVHVVEEALAQNRNLAAAAARIDAAVAQARIAGADLQPQLAFGLSGSRGKQNFIGLPIPGGENRVLSNTTSTFGTSLNVSWEADLWGRLRAGKAAALADVEATQADFAAARLSLAGQTSKAWFAVLEGRKQVELSTATLKSRRRSRERIQRRYLTGVRPALDLRFAVTNEAAAVATLAVRRRQLDLATRQLELLLSGYPNGRLGRDAEASDLPRVPATMFASLPSELVSRRPDLMAAEHRLAAAGFQIQQARASLYPQLRFGGSAGTLTGEIEDLLDDDLSVWSLAANLLQPLYQGGRLKAGVELSEARYRELAERYVQLVLQSFAEVESALAAEQFLEVQEQALTEAAVQSAAAERLANERYDAGLADYLSVLEAQRDAFLAQSELLNARRLRLDTRVDLHLALGGGFSGAAYPSVGEAGATADLPGATNPEDTAPARTPEPVKGPRKGI
jgi:NodT family efflux transporter outer membrane factor (OMF) lipoprotein